MKIEVLDVCNGDIEAASCSKNVWVEKGQHASGRIEEERYENASRGGEKNGTENEVLPQVEELMIVDTDSNVAQNRIHDDQSSGTKNINDKSLGNHHSGDKKDKPKSSMIRLKLNKNTRIIDKRRTLITLIFSEDIIQKWILPIYKSKVTVFVILISWLALSIEFMYVCFQINYIPIDIYIGAQLILSINFCLLHSIFIRVDIVKELMKSFNFWYTLWNVISMHLCAIFLWGFKAEVFCATTHSFTSTVTVLLLFDAHAAKESKAMKIASIIGITSLIPVLVCLSLKLVDFETEKIYYAPMGLELVDLRLHAIDNITTFMIYILRIFYNHLVREKTTTIVFVSEFYEIDEEKKVSQLGERKMHASESKPRKNDEENAEPNIRMDSVVPSSTKKSNRTTSPNHKSAFKEEPEIYPKRDNGTCEKSVAVDQRYALEIGTMKDKSIEYDLHLTIYHQYMKNNWPLISGALASKTYNRIGLLFTISSIIMSPPLCAGVDFGYLFHYLGLVCLVFAIVFAFIQMVISTNFVVSWYMIRTFDFWYFMFLIAKIFFAAGLLCNWDYRMFVWFYSALALTWCFMIDTFHVKARNLSFLHLFGIFWMLTIAILCKLNIGGTFGNDKYVNLMGVSFMSARITLSSSALSGCIFFLRSYWSYYRNPNRILFMTENIRVEKLTNYE